MSVLDRIPSPPRRAGDEWLDDLPTAEITPSSLSASLREVWRLNRLVGATRAVWRETELMLPQKHASLLDIGTGPADLPLAFTKWASQQGWHLDVTALDSSSEMLEEAHRRMEDESVTLVLGDGRDLRYPDGAFDVVTSLGVLHHLDEEDACRLLMEMWRVARSGIVLMDLERTYPTQLIGRLALRVLTRNQLTQHDGLVSLRRSYTLCELRNLAESARIPGAVIRRRRTILMSLTARKF